MPLLSFFFGFGFGFVLLLSFEMKNDCLFLSSW